MTQVTRSHEYAASADDMWRRIGDFNGLSGWHPAVVSSDVGEGEGSRVLVLADGGQIFETKTSGDAHSYGYRIDEGPLPVADYSSVLSVDDREGGGCEVSWSAEFEAAGATEEEASALIGGIFDAGLQNL